MKPNQLFEQLISKKDLSTIQMQEAIHQCMTGQLNDIQIGTFLALMRMKGESIEELTAAAQMMHQLARPINLGPNLIDIV
ncbi:MAG: anthranilate phosphoribosyltransferase, partial [bacterium]|nr:anthranilate phosphoribosyltransferase [bacterium]